MSSITFNKQQKWRRTETVNVKVHVQQSEGVAALGVPFERLEAVGSEVAGIGMTDPHWSKQPAYAISLGYSWGGTPITIGVKKNTGNSTVNFDILFMLTSEIEALGFRQVEG